jgi:hypothetical protein
VFWPLQLRSEFSKVPEDSQVPFSRVWMATSHFPQSAVATVVLKSRQLKGREREYLVKWKGYHPIEASWVNESDMEHAQEAIEEFHIKPAKKKRHRTWWGHHLSFSRAGCHIKCTTSNCKWNKSLRTSKRLYHQNNVWVQIGLSSLAWDKWNFLRSPNQNQVPTLGWWEILTPKRGGKQGELVGTFISLKCITKGWLVVAANVGSHYPVPVL